MPGYVLQDGCVIQCPHGGMVQVRPFPRHRKFSTITIPVHYHNLALLWADFNSKINFFADCGRKAIRVRTKPNPV